MDAPERCQGGKPPYGYLKNIDGFLEENPETYPVLQIIKAFEITDGRSREIQKSLKERGHIVSHMTIWRIIKKMNNLKNT